MKHRYLSSIFHFCFFATLIFPAGLFLPSSITPPPPSVDQAYSTQLAEPGLNFTGCGGSLVPVLNSQYEARVLELVNSERTSRGIPPLKRITLLDDASRYHAKDMADDNYFDHDSYDRSGSSLVKACAWYNRISSYYSGWSNLGENIAAGYATPADVMTGWMNSQGHQDNILSTSYWEIGVGYYEGSGSYYRYWVQDFGKRSGFYPAIINNDALSTTSRDVSLYIYGDWTEMRLRNNSAAWTAWQPFSHTLSWQLPPLTGTHTVYVELRKIGVNAASSDTIFLDYPLQPVLGNLPDVITMTYSIPSQTFIPSSTVVTPENVGTTSVLIWQADTTDNWIDLDPQTGSTPQNLTITLTNFNKNIVSNYNGSFTVTISSPPGVAGSPHQVSVRLYVVDDQTHYTYIPALFR